MGLTVAVTGPTGELGISVVEALEREADVDAGIGMARRPFDPQSRGWRKTVYRPDGVRDHGRGEATTAADLHIVGRRIRLLPGHAFADHGGGPGARLARALLLCPEGRLRAGTCGGTGGSPLEVYVLRPCIVAGPRATLIVRNLPRRRTPAMLDRAWRAL